MIFGYLLCSIAYTTNSVIILSHGSFREQNSGLCFKHMTEMSEMINNYITDLNGNVGHKM